jgi:hypothetical protein
MKALHLRLQSKHKLQLITIEYLKSGGFLFHKDGAKPPARKGCSAYASESDIHKYSILRLGRMRYGAVNEF